MKNNRMGSKIFVFPILWVVMALLILLIVAVFASGCKVQDIKQKKTEQVDSSYIRELKETVANLTTSNADLTRLVKELEQSSVSFKPQDDCDTTIVKQFLKYGYDSSQVDKLFKVLAAQRDEIEYLSDGTVRIKGRLSAMTFMKQRSDSLNLKLQEEVSLLRRLNDSLSKNVVIKKEEKQKDTRANLQPGRLLFPLIIILVIGFIIYLMSYKGKSRKILSIKRFLHL